MVCGATLKLSHLESCFIRVDFDRERLCNWPVSSIHPSIRHSMDVKIVLIYQGSGCSVSASRIPEELALFKSVDVLCLGEQLVVVHVLHHALNVLFNCIFQHRNVASL